MAKLTANQGQSYRTFPKLIEQAPSFEMNASVDRLTLKLAGGLAVLSVALAGCAPASVPSPTQALPPTAPPQAPTPSAVAPIVLPSSPPPTSTVALPQGGPRPRANPPSGVTRDLTATSVSKYVTHPEFANVMPITVTRPASGTAPGLVFLATQGRNTIYDPALFIIDNTAEPIYIRNFPREFGPQITVDFKKQVVNGQEFLTYHLGGRNGMVSTGKFYVVDQGYSLKSMWDIGESFRESGVDQHDFLLLENGGAVVFSYVQVPYDLSPFGGPKDGAVLDVVLQEQDAARKIVFQWRGLDHVPLTDTYIPLTSTTPVDYMHANGIAIDFDGNFLMSNRNTSDVIKIERNTGKVLWRLGGKKNMFDFRGDRVTSYQHDIRRLPNGRITLFDNGNLQDPKTSRMVEYEIDEINKVLTRTWQFPNDNSRFAPATGNAQRLPNGNTIGSWGAMTQLTEVTPSGDIAFEAELGALTYRAFRFPWQGTPAEPPRLAAITTSLPTSITLYFSWNGATDITAYDILVGSSIKDTARLTTTARAGFESSAVLAGLPSNACVFQVRPVRGNDRSLPLSNTFIRTDTAACKEVSNAVRP